MRLGGFRFKWFLGIGVLAAAVFFFGNRGEAKTLTEEEKFMQEVDSILADMTLEEKVYQLFIITPEALTGVKTVTAAGETTRKSMDKYPVGGLIYFAQNLKNPEQTAKMLRGIMEFSYEMEGLPLFTCIDEEGGRVAKICRNASFGVDKIGCMRDVKDVDEAYAIGETIGAYLSKLGFNLNFAPDADVLTNKDNTVIGDRSFGEDPDRVTELAAAFSDGLHSRNVLSTFKHFPGHGATLADTHKGFAYTDKTYDELLKSELKPFMAAREKGVDIVMAAHISVPKVTGNDLPCTLSKKMITEVLRDDLGYEGIIITDALDMGAITQNYDSAKASVMALDAGVDMLLMPQDFKQAAQGILEAVKGGEISEERINESLRRIIKAKLLWKDHCL